jgi:hypothetical protein
MAEMIRKKESKLPGPWLLDRAALAALDEIIDEQWSRLEAHKKGQIEDAVQAEQDGVRKSGPNPGSNEGACDVDSEIERRAKQDSRYSGDGRTVVLTLASGNKIRVNSFREAINDVSCQEHEIAKVEVKLYCGGIRGDLVVPTADISQGLSLVALPEASEQADELFVRLNGWAEQYKPDLLRRIRGMGPIFAWVIALMALAVILVILLMTGVAAETNSLTDAVRDLVAKGVKPEDYGRALELLLRESPGYPKQNGVLTVPAWFNVAAIILAAIAALLSFQARTAFDIGKGAASVLRQRRYDWFLRKAIPAFFIVGVLRSAVGSWILEMFRSK